MAYLVDVPPGTVVTGEKILDFGTPNNGINDVAVYIDVTAVSGSATPTLTPYLETLASDGVWYAVWTGSGITATGQTIATAGPNNPNHPAVFGAQSRLRLEVSGTTPSFTLSASVIGR